MAISASSVVGSALAGCTLGADASPQADESQTAQSITIIPINPILLGMNTVPYPGTAIAWPTNAQRVVVMLHNGYAAGTYCTTTPPPCTTPAYGHGLVVGIDASGNASVSQIFQFEASIADRFIYSVNATYANTSPVGYLGWSIQGGLSGPPLPPHGPGGDQQYSADDLTLAANNVADQFADTQSQSAHQY